MNISKDNESYFFPSTTDLFTDRESLQEAFERKLLLFNDENVRKHAYGIISYYGIGGIGKTAFKNRLIRLIKHVYGVASVISPNSNDNKPVYPFYASFDFNDKNIESNKLNILISIRNQLVNQDKRFKFLYFDAAIITYLKKTGQPISDNSSHSLFLENNFWLNTGLDIIGIMPKAESTIAIVQILDRIGGYLKNQKNKRKAELFIKRMNYLEPSEILANIHKYFCDDMNDIVNNQNKNIEIDRPIVIFLDGYEKYVDNIYYDSIQVDNDYWLRKDPDSLIKSMPGILWVILGREKLDWRVDDNYWGTETNYNDPYSKLSIEQKNNLAKNILEQHFIEGLSEFDSIDLLKRAGIKDEKLCKQLFDLTNGTPMFLDICIKQFYILVRNNETISSSSYPTIKDFGNDVTELTNTYLKNLPSDLRQMLFMMSIIEKWNDVKFKTTINNMGNPYWYNDTRYINLLKHSFVISDENGKYYIHDTVKKACINMIDPAFLKQVHNCSAKFVHNLINRNDYSNIDSIVCDTVFVGADYKEAYNYWNDIIKILAHNHKQGLFINNCSLLFELYKKVNIVFPDSDYLFVIKQKLILWLIYAGKINEATYLFKHDNPHFDINITNFDYFFSALTDKIEVLNLMEKYNDALSMAKVLFESCKKRGIYDTQYYRSMSTLASSYQSAGEYNKALELFKILYQKSKDDFGEKDIDTLYFLTDIADIYSNLGNYKDSLDLYNIIYSYEKLKFGDSHPDTLSVHQKIAIAYKNMGDLENALANETRVYNKAVKKFGEYHPDSLSALSIISELYADLEIFDMAIKYSYDTYYKSKYILGENHPLTLQYMHNIGRVYFLNKKYDIAIKKYNLVYKSRKKELGINHIDTLNSLLQTAICYLAVDNHEKALEITNKVYLIYSFISSEPLLFHENLDSLSLLDQIGFTYAHLNKNQQALNILSEVYKKRESLLGDNHPDTLNTLDEKTMIDFIMGNTDKSIPIFKEIYNKRKKILGKNHPTTISMWNRIKDIVEAYDNYYINT